MNVCAIRNACPDDSQEPSEIKLWLLRILVRLGAYKRYVRDTEVVDDDVARMVGLADCAGPGRKVKDFDRQEVVDRLHREWSDIERTAEGGGVPPSRHGAIERIGEAIGLQEVEIDILRFRLAVAQHKELRVVLNGLESLTLIEIVEVFSVCLQRPLVEVKSALTFGSALLASGIIDLTLHQGWHFTDSVSLLGCLVDEVQCDHEDPIRYFRSRIEKSAAPRLTSGHFPHVHEDLAILCSYLANTLERHRAGVNVLIYGEPGTGKTEFVRMLAAELGANLYEVSSSQRDGAVMDAQLRFRAYRLGQFLLARSSRHMILFDEIEDVFQESDRGPRPAANLSNRKALVNKMLETNPIPAFWVSNNVKVIDRAYLRRFDYVLEMKVPPKSVRGRIFDSYFADLPVTDGWKRRMTEHEDLVPAVVERAAKVLKAIEDRPEPVATERALTRMMGNTLDVMGLARNPRNRPSMETAYRLDVLNADCDMDDVLSGLREFRQGRLCLYGPPGTGKTAFGQHVADVLDWPLLVRRASDLISPFLGMTERNMARMFRLAEEESAVLLLDEADSFLQDRQGALRSWEISEVNEMLTQMESFEGIFIASTNLMESIDAAALRRFDLKIRFDYLAPHQASAMFEDTARRLGLDGADDVRENVLRLDLLTPGDFANVVRQSRLRRIDSAKALLHRLAAECSAKPGGRRRPIGFGN